MFDFAVVTHWVDTTLRLFLPEPWVTIAEFVLIGICLLIAYAVMALGLDHTE